MLAVVEVVVELIVMKATVVALVIVSLDNDAATLTLRMRKSHADLLSCILLPGT